MLLMNLVITNCMDPLFDLQTAADVLPSFLTATSNVIEDVSFDEGGIHLRMVSISFHVQALQCSL